MKFGTLYSYWGNEWKCNYTEVIQKTAEIGFDILEIGADHIYHMTDKELEELKTAAENYQIELTTNSGPPKEYDVASSNPQTRRNGISYLNTILKNMDKINSRTLVGGIYSFWPCDFQEVQKEEAWDRSISSLKEISRTAECLGITCALEVMNRFETYLLNNHQEAIAYCKEIDSSNINILLDTFHMNIEEDNMIEAFRRTGDLLGHVHVGENNRKLPGMNHSFDWKAIGQVLKEMDYKKGIVMEPFLLTGGAVGNDIKVWRDLSNEADEKMMNQYIRDSLHFLKKNFA